MAAGDVDKRMTRHAIEQISTGEELSRLVGRLDEAPAMAIDIETIDWWSRESERISVVQIAFREESTIVVAIVDLLARLSIEPLRRPLELSPRIKVMHNASFDAVRLARHCGISTSPIHDTMVAARRSGEKKCSLKALVERHLGIAMDKEEQRSDWSRRPLSDAQLRYAALDAASTLLLYERQRSLGLTGSYQLKNKALAEKRVTTTIPPTRTSTGTATAEMSPLAAALRSIVSEFPGRYSPRQLAILASAERTGKGGWIIDCLLGPETAIDERQADAAIRDLCEKGVLAIDTDGRLEVGRD